MYWENREVGRKATFTKFLAGRVSKAGERPAKGQLRFCITLITGARGLREWRLLIGSFDTLDKHR